MRSIHAASLLVVLAGAGAVYLYWGHRAEEVVPITSTEGWTVKWRSEPVFIKRTPEDAGGEEVANL